jgi:hypothetical protein
MLCLTQTAPPINHFFAHLYHFPCRQPPLYRTHKPFPTKTKRKSQAQKSEFYRELRTSITAFCTSENICQNLPPRSLYTNYSTIVLLTLQLHCRQYTSMGASYRSIGASFTSPTQLYLTTTPQSSFLKAVLAIRCLQRLRLDPVFYK